MSFETDDPTLLPPVTRLSRDLATASKTISDVEARFLVDSYYQNQDARIRVDGQIRSIRKNPVETGELDDDGNPILAVEPHDMLGWLSKQHRTLEQQVKRSLEKYVSGHTVGEWLLGVFGIGPVISAGLLAHIDIKEAPTVGHIWAFAGLDPTAEWNKGEKRPWNADLKTLCWKAGESFVKFSGSENCFYGHVWRRQKDVYIKRNEGGLFADRAAKILTERKIGKDTDAYKAYSIGKLPPAHIHAMARRYAVKLFLAHLHDEMYRRILKTEPPLPYPIAHLGHAHVIKPPH